MILVLSPHLDDAVLSVGALLAARAAAGDDVVVATVFSKVEDARREAEDVAALRLLGCQHRHLGLDDAPLRGVAKTTAALCAGEPDVDVTDAVGRALDGLIAAEAPAELWVPLAVGGHIDHVAVLRAALGRAARHVAVLFEDRPYARQRGAVAAAWARLDARPAGTAGAAHVSGDVDERVFFLEAVGARPLTDIAAPAAVSVRGRHWQRHAHVVDNANRERRRLAIARYESEADLLIGPGADGGWPWDDAHEFTWRPGHA
jgi:LmbE family N-acetylglucosaminyl deacetylase